MKVAIISDIHGNSAALRSMLTDARKEDTEHLLILGDLVGYYYDIRGVLDLLAEWPRTIISGNHEYLLDQARTNKEAATLYRAKYGSAIDIALTTLTTQELDWLAQLPPRLSKNIDAITFELCHGAPDDRDRYVYPTASESELAACEIKGRVVLMGHTHYPMMALREGCTLLNPGSIGQARDFGGFAAWMLVDTMTGIVVPRRSPYDRSRLVAETAERDPGLPYLSEILNRNRAEKHQHDL